jgi:hypothetical protein
LDVRPDHGLHIVSNPCNVKKLRVFEGFQRAQFTAKLPIREGAPEPTLSLYLRITSRKSDWSETEISHCA